MSLRKRLLFATLFPIAALVLSGRVNFKAQSDAPMPDAWLRAPMSLAALYWRGNLPAIKPSRWIKPFGRKSKALPAFFVPIQFKNSKDLDVGKLLVASRRLGDPAFAETVVLLVHYDEKGVVGLVLNRRTDVPISRVLELKAAKDRSDPVYLGGPVGTSNVFALFHPSVKIKKAESIFDGIYLISDKELFEQTLSARPDPNVFHVYLGYAGWTKDQLLAEVQSGAWYVFRADDAAVFNSDPDSLWLQMIRKTELKWAKTEPFAVVSPSEGIVLANRD